MTLTIFTPTFNRAYCLSKLYESLCRQTSGDFCWLIVDDGSTDNTEELVGRFALEKKINIRYCRQDNAGKHVAHNKGVELCETELFFCVDSDDYLTDDAVEVILKRNDELKDRKLLGYFYRRIRENGENIASPYPPGIDEIGIEDLYHKYDFSGDTAVVFRTNMIEDKRFPVFQGEKFVTERVLYNSLNQRAPMRLCEERIYVCEYLTDGYTKNIGRVMCQNPYGTALDFLIESNTSYKLIGKVKNYAQFLSFFWKKHLKKDVFRDYSRPQFWVRFIGTLVAVPAIPYFKRKYKPYF